ncbi:cytochrome b561 and DOMON domain-containing protein At3g25290-like [Salvia miltiorrhiza]|uniref:cytochrome b561 and DOMON domain-containing protein At3g25290-like n=1 Tax=Salvia miltiorrhiza TaxID=226208 RepID=UPI0025AC0EE6|nr:cytochrome b561 and DOMON domain-containing protein At3g25290-like [Salvia miltiorrhiza]
MASLPHTLIFLLALASLLSPSQPAAPCASRRFSNGKTYALCADLPALGASLHWAYDEARSALAVAFVAAPARPDGWISWAINPTGSGMRGSQALVAFRGAGGGMTVKTFNVSAYALDAAADKVWFEVEESAAESSGGVMTLFASLVLPEKGITVVNHVWQVGGAVDGGEKPEGHGFEPDNMNAEGSLDLLSGIAGGGPGAGGDYRTKRRNIHGLLNVISWGFMFPAGAMIARYLRVFPSADPAWFYLHVSCQLSAYAIGVAGWGTGLKLGSESVGITHTYHRYIGITLFALATLQIFALVLRPGKNHKFRQYWNVYHRTIGDAIIGLGIINVFKGFAILKPQQKWRTTYIVVIAALGCIAIFLEAITWAIVLRRKRQNKPMSHN